MKPLDCFSDDPATLYAWRNARVYAFEIGAALSPERLA